MYTLNMPRRIDPVLCAIGYIEFKQLFDIFFNPDIFKTDIRNPGGTVTDYAESGMAVYQAAAACNKDVTIADKYIFNAWAIGFETDSNAVTERVTDQGIVCHADTIDKGIFIGRFDGNAVVCAAEKAVIDGEIT